MNWAPGMSIAQRRLIEAAQAQMGEAREKLAVSREMLEKSQQAALAAQKEQEAALRRRLRCPRPRPRSRPKRRKS